MNTIRQKPIKMYTTANIQNFSFVSIFPFGKSSKPSEKAKMELIKNADILLLDLQDLEGKAIGFVQGKVPVEELREALTKARLSFKKSEFLLEYFYVIFPFW